MACQSITLAEIDARCDASVGGIKEIYIANRDDVNLDIIKDSKDVIINGVSMKDPTTKKFETWKFRKNTGNYTSTASMDPVIGTNFVTTEVSLQFSRAEAEKRLKIQSALNANAIVIVRDMYDNYLFLGEENDVVVTACTMQSGTSGTDLSGFNITFQDITQELPKFITKELVDTLLVLEEDDDSAE